MVRIIVLDVTGVYTQIYDEVYCEKERYEEVINNYRKPCYLCVAMHEDSDGIMVIND